MGPLTAEWVGPVIGVSESPAAIRRPAALLGQHTDEVLREWLDLPPERIAALRATGAITVRERP